MEFSGKEVIEHFKKKGHVIKRAPWSFWLSVMIVSVVLCGGCYWLVDHLYASAEKANEVALKAKDATIETISAQRDNYKKQLDDAGLAPPSSVKGGGSKVITTDLADRLDVGKNAVVLGKFTGSVAEGAVVLRPDGTNQFGDPNTLEAVS